MTASDKKYAGIVIAYNRPESVRDSIDSLLNQTLTPGIVLVVDNSTDSRVEHVVSGMHDRVVYRHNGGNLGPAGSAKVATDILLGMGYEYAVIVGDDRPLPFMDVCEYALSKLLETGAGVVGYGGCKFSKRTAKMRAHTLAEWQDDAEWDDLIDADSIDGERAFFFNLEAARRVGYHDSALFFGFEELDLCLRMKNAGYGVYILRRYADVHRRNQSHEYVRLAKIQTVTRKLKSREVSRQYYSIRNLIYIMLRKEHSGAAAARDSAPAFDQTAARHYSRPTVCSWVCLHVAEGGDSWFPGKARSLR